ncbi:MAG: hypothetical protein RR547_00025, partial [Raoultibacter sp.]
MSKQARDTRLKLSFANRCAAVCVTVLLALSPAGMIAFAADGATNSGAAGVQNKVAEAGTYDALEADVMIAPGSVEPLADVVDTLEVDLKWINVPE